MVNTIAGSKKYIESLLLQIERIKKSGGTAIYRINDRMTKTVASEVSKYFSVAPYTIEIRKCVRCRDEYDIIIYF